MAGLLNYGEPQILELFRNTLPSKLYWILFSINNLRDAADAAKRVLTKEKLDKQLSGQSGATPFMKVGDVSHSSKKTSFNAQDPIREQLENLTTMVYNMSIQKEENNRPFKPQIYPKRGRGQNRQNFGNRDRNSSLRWIDKDKTLDPTTGDNCKIEVYNVEMIVEEEVIDVRIIAEMTVAIEGDKMLEVLVMTIEVDQEKEA